MVVITMAISQSSKVQDKSTADKGCACGRHLVVTWGHSQQTIVGLWGKVEGRARYGLRVRSLLSYLFAVDMASHVEVGVDLGRNSRKKQVDDHHPSSLEP